MTDDLKRYKVAHGSSCDSLDRDTLHELILETFVSSRPGESLEPVGYFRGLILASAPVNEKHAQVLVVDVDSNDLVQYPVSIETMQLVQEHFQQAEPVFLVGVQIEGQPHIQMIVEGDDEDLHNLFLMLYGPQTD